MTFFAISFSSALFRFTSIHHPLFYEFVWVTNHRSLSLFISFLRFLFLGCKFSRCYKVSSLTHELTFCLLLKSAAKTSTSSGGSNDTSASTFLNSSLPWTWTNFYLKQFWCITSLAKDHQVETSISLLESRLDRRVNYCLCFSLSRGRWSSVFFLDNWTLQCAGLPSLPCQWPLLPET